MTRDGEKHRTDSGGQQQLRHQTKGGLPAHSTSRSAVTLFTSGGAWGRSALSTIAVERLKPCASFHISMAIFLIALLPALAVVLVAAVTHSILWTTLAALLAAALGAATGNPAYTTLDVAAVALAYWLSRRQLKTLRAKHPQVANPSSPPKTVSSALEASPRAPVAAVKRAAFLVLGSVLLGATLVMLFVVVDRSSGRDSVRIAPIAPPQAKAVTAETPKPPQRSPSAARPPSGRPTNTQVPAAKPTVQDCLHIEAERKMADCLARTN